MKKTYTRHILCSFLFILICLLIFSCDSEEADIERGNRYINRGDYVKAIQNYSFAIKTNPSNPDAYFYRGIANLKVGNNNNSLNDFTMAIKLKPNYFEAYINRGSIYKEEDELDEALLNYNMAVKIKPNDIKALMVRADILFNKRLFDSAISDYDMVISHDQNNFNAFRGRADAYYQNNSYQKAINDYQAAIEINPNDVFSYNNLAWLLSTCVDEQFRDSKSALQLSKKAVAIDPNLFNLSTLAAAYAETGDYEKAVSILSELIESRDMNDDTKGELNRYLSSFRKQTPLRLKAGK